MSNQGKTWENKLSVSLIDGCQYPVETVYCLWEASKGRDDIVNPEQVRMEMNYPGAYGVSVMEEYKARVENLFTKLLDDAVPIMENIHFTFMLEHIPIYLREQLVRHRIVSSVGDRIGADIIPDLHKSTFWAQSMRILNMGEFATTEEFHVPESVADAEWPEGNAPAMINSGLREWQETMRTCETAYNRLVAMGVPEEDARGVIPLAATHRLSWTLNLKALKHIVGNRSCWILQAGIWGSVIQGMVDCLVEKYGIIFRQLINPPCIKHNKFSHCPFVEDNERRIRGEDKLSPCTLYLQQEEPEQEREDNWHRQGEWSGLVEYRFGPSVSFNVDGGNEGVWMSYLKDPAVHMMKQIELYEKLWGRNVWTGELIV